MRYASKLDANQTEIKDALEAKGVLVLSLATLGKGKPDLLAYHPPSGQFTLLEVKNPKGKNIVNQAQQDFAKLWPVHVVRNIEEARIAIVGEPAVMQAIMRVES